MASQPLDDISVVELSTMIAAPYAGQLLGDLGADVVKIERPGSGEFARELEPTVAGVSFYYLTANRNKRSLALDVTTADGRDAFYRLVERADVVLENFHPEFTETYDIDFASLQEYNDELVYCSISGFGESGPYRDDPGIDTTVQALTGAMSMTRDETSKPMRTGVPLNDVFAALYAVQGILTALYRRERTGEGEFVDVSLLDAGIAGLTTRAMYSLVSNDPYPPFGRRHNYLAPEGAYEVADGDVQLSVVTDRHWRRFCEAINEPALAEDERFGSVNERVANRDVLDEQLTRLLADWTVEDLVASLRARGVPAAPVNDTCTVWEHPQVKARDMRRTLDHPKAGPVDTLGFPVKYANITQDVDRHPPLLGEHSEEVLAAHGYSEKEIEDLVADGVVDTPE